MSSRYFKKKFSQSQFHQFQDYIKQIDLKYAIKLGDKLNHDCAIVFFELNNFNNISCSLSTEQVFKIVHDLYQFITECVIRYRGLVNKYPYSGVVAYFPRNYKDERKIVVGEALDCIGEVMYWFYNTLRKRWSNDEQPSYKLDLSVGLDAGNIYIAHSGSVYHSELILLGDQVNCAHKCKSAAQKSEVVIGQDAVDRAGFLYGKYFEEGPNLWVVYNAKNVNYGSKIFNWKEFIKAASWIKKNE